MSRAILWPVPEPPLWFKDILVQPFMADRAIVALDIGVLLGLAGLDVPDVGKTVCLFLGNLML